MNFKIGQKVVCVDANFDVNREIYGVFKDLWKFPAKGEIYTIRGVIDDEALLLEEIVNLECDIGEPSFYMYHFRPVTLSYSILNQTVNEKEL